MPQVGTISSRILCNISISSLLPSTYLPPSLPLSFPSLPLSFPSLPPSLPPSLLPLPPSLLPLPPSLSPSLSLVFAMFGMLSPASRGALMAAAIVLFMFMDTG